MRITLDLDNMKDKVVKGKAILLKLAFPNSTVKYRRSSSGKGGHIEVINADIDEESMYRLRTLMGDHDKRISIDISRHINNNYRLPQQVLFDFKIVDGIIKRASEWKEVKTHDLQN